MTTPAETAPIPSEGQTPQEFILEIASWLAEPHRRRLGTLTQMHVEEAVRQMNIAPLTEALRTAASQPIESLTDFDRLNDAEATSRDITERIANRIKALS